MIVLGHLHETLRQRRVQLGYTDDLGIAVVSNLNASRGLNLHT